MELNQGPLGDLLLYRLLYRYHTPISYNLHFVVHFNQLGHQMICDKWTLNLDIYILKKIIE